MARQSGLTACEGTIGIVHPFSPQLKQELQSTGEYLLNAFT